MTLVHSELQQQIMHEVEQGFVRVTEHSEAPYRLFTYTQRGVIEGDWTYARKMCRGLIVNDAWEIIARPFPKFFNWGELSLDEQKRLEGRSFRAYEKLDGSLGIIYPMPDGSLRVATRGSFDSEQAQWATEWLEGYPLDVEYLTPCVEIIYPENRIVVDYGGKRELVYLAGVSKMTGNILTDPSLVGWADATATDYGSKRNIDDLTDVPDDGTHEGYVLYYETGDLVKVKLDEYVRLHRIVTNTTARTVWEHLRTGESIQELVDNVPEEFEWWVRETAQALELTFSHRFYQAHEEHERIVELVDGQQEDPATWRRRFAEEAKKYPHPGLLFAILDNRDITDAVWKMIRPEHETPFKIEER